MPRVVCEWGLAAIESWRARAAAFVIVDVLSFSTAVSVAIDRGAEIIPFPLADRATAAAEAHRRGAILASPRRAGGGQPSLSPASLRRLQSGARLLLPSPNGSRLSLATGATPTFAGSLRNAESVARAARNAAADGLIVVVAAGERWPDDTLRPAIEDWLGAGAIIKALGGSASAEAELARLAFDAAGPDLAAMIRDSLSGRELAERGFRTDVEIALEIGRSESAPRLVDGVYRNAA